MKQVDFSKINYADSLYWTLRGMGYEPGHVWHREEQKTPCGGYEVICEFDKGEHTIVATICHHCDRILHQRFKDNLNVHADIGETFELLDRLPPIPVAIWLIDRPGWYHTIYNLFVDPDGDVPSSRFFGLALHNWRLVDLEERIEKLHGLGWPDEKIRRVFPFWEPGVWVEMNKGPHVKLDEGEG